MSWVTDPTNELLVHLVDAKGTRATNQYWLANSEVDPAGGAAAAISAAIQGISADEVYLVEILRRAGWSLAVVPTDGPYPRAADKVKLEFSGADGSVTIMEVPGPNETIVDSGKINVNTADTALAAFVTYVLAHCVSSEGAALTSLKKGYRRRPPRRKSQ